MMMRARSVATKGLEDTNKSAVWDACKRRDGSLDFTSVSGVQRNQIDAERWRYGLNCRKLCNRSR